MKHATVDGHVADGFAGEIANPLGLEFWIGLPARLEPRVCPLVAPDLSPLDPATRALIDRVTASDTLIGRTTELGGLLKLPDAYNTAAVRAAEIGSANGVTNARFYAGLIGVVENGPAKPLLSAGQVGLSRTVHTSGSDRVATS